MFRPRIIVSEIVLTVLGVGCCFMLPDSVGYLGIFLLGLATFMPINIYRALAKAVDGNSQWTDRKTVEYNASNLVVTGPDWRNETTWSRFKGFSEDALYFYLPISDNGIAAIFPKSAFTPDQQQKFRQCANKRTA